MQGKVLFSGIADLDGAWTEEEDQFAQMMEVFGNFPSNLLSQGKNTRQYFSDEGIRINKTVHPYRPKITLFRSLATFWEWISPVYSRGGDGIHKKPIPRWCRHTAIRIFSSKYASVSAARSEECCRSCQRPVAVELVGESHGTNS